MVLDGVVKKTVDEDERMTSVEWIKNQKRQWPITLRHDLEMHVIIMIEYGQTSILFLFLSCISYDYDRQEFFTRLFYSSCVCNFAILWYAEGKCKCKQYITYLYTICNILFTFIFEFLYFLTLLETDDGWKMNLLRWANWKPADNDEFDRL